MLELGFEARRVASKTTIDLNNRFRRHPQIVGLKALNTIPKELCGSLGAREVREMLTLEIRFYG